MSESIEQTIFRLIETKDEKGIQDLINRGFATQKMIAEQRKSYRKIYEEEQLNELLISLKNYTILNMLTIENSCKISVFVGLERNNDGKAKIVNKGHDKPLYEEVIWDLTKQTLKQQSEETRNIISSWRKNNRGFHA